jgi:hypothetical protein
VRQETETAAVADPDEDDTAAVLAKRVAAQRAHDQQLSLRLQMEGELRAYRERVQDLESEQAELLEINRADLRRFQADTARRDRELRELREALGKAEAEAVAASERASRAEHRARTLADETGVLRAHGARQASA